MKLNVLVKRELFEPFSNFKAMKTSYPELRRQTMTTKRLTHPLNAKIDNLT